jgi:hypothetical protein
MFGPSGRSRSSAWRLLQAPLLQSMYSVPCKVTTTLLQVLSSLPLPLPLSLQNLVVLNMLRPLRLMIVFPRCSSLPISPESDQADIPLMFMHQGCAVSVAARARGNHRPYGFAGGSLCGKSASTCEQRDRAAIRALITLHPSLLDRCLNYLGNSVIAEQPAALTDVAAPLQRM